MLEVKVFINSVKRKTSSSFLCRSPENCAAHANSKRRIVLRSKKVRSDQSDARIVAASEGVNNVCFVPK